MDKTKQLQKLLALSRERGFKLTPQRMIIYRIICETEKHLTVDEVYQKARQEYPMLSAATVYRNMEQMVEAGLLSHLGQGGSATRYDANLEEHHHFICSRCKKVLDIYLREVNYELDAEKSRLGEAKIDSPELYLRGVCQGCLDNR